MGGWGEGRGDSGVVTLFWKTLSKTLTPFWGEMLTLFRKTLVVLTMITLLEVLLENYKAILENDNIILETDRAIL